MRKILYNVDTESMICSERKRKYKNITLFRYRFGETASHESNPVLLWFWRNGVVENL